MNCPECNNKAKLSRTTKYIGYVWRRYICEDDTCDTNRFSTRAISSQAFGDKITVETVL